MRVAAWTVLLELKTIGIVTTVFARDVVTVLAVLARHRCLGTNVVLCHRVHLPCGPWGGPSINYFVVARAGLEPATQRL